MPQWAQTHDEIVHLVETSKKIPIGGIAEITLNNGQIIEGIIRRTSQGNNAGRDGHWCYYGEIEVETKEKLRWVLDYSEITDAKNVWTKEKSKEYEKLGLITIVDYKK